VKWFGQVVRMDGKKTVRKILEGKPRGERTKGRPRIRWMDDVEQDVMNMGVKKCKTRPVEGRERASLMKESTTNLKRVEVLKREQNKRNYFDVKTLLFHIQYLIF
jgi:hypothetical protein